MRNLLTQREERYSKKFTFSRRVTSTDSPPSRGGPCVHGNIVLKIPPRGSPRNEEVLVRRPRAIPATRHPRLLHSHGSGQQASIATAAWSPSGRSWAQTRKNAMKQLTFIQESGAFTHTTLLVSDAPCPGARLRNLEPPQGHLDHTNLHGIDQCKT